RQGNLSGRRLGAHIKIGAASAPHKKTMICVLNFSEAFEAYVLLIVGVLVALYCLELWWTKAHAWRIHRLTVHKCASCGLVFAVGRFALHSTVKCPRCNHKQNGFKGKG
ncbi:MAG: hypothetical protein J5746_04740, partial [Victivallales bacterium]|nr:hypothetical protein [Victivallales bacterium]